MFTRLFAQQMLDARVEAIRFGRKRITTLDLLLVVLSDQRVQRAIHDLGADRERLGADAEEAARSWKDPFTNEDDLWETPLFRDVIALAERAQARLEQSAVDAVIALYAILSRTNTTASTVIQRAGIEKGPLEAWIIVNPVPQAEREQDAPDGLASALGVPHQAIAPVRLVERDGLIGLSGEHTEEIDADALDFDRWRAPVAERLDDLLSGDFRPGTNHERLRRRLLALAAVLAGTIDEVKGNQFRLGYGIESLGDLVGVYRDAADDMPTLNAAVFADVNRLHIQLMLGLSKLVAWSRFQAAADADAAAPESEGGADPAAVAVALAEAEAVLAGDAARPIVDPELPASFRWLREAIADPREATRRMVYGAVKSLENVGSFLGQLALRTAKEVAEGVASTIGKRASAALLLGLSGALLHLSGALPVAWPWLKPLLEAAAKVVGG